MTTAQTLVQASARVVTITELAEGDVYQRLVVATYSGGKDELKYGLVTKVLNNGEDTVIQGLEIDIEYTSPKPKVVTFGTNREVSIFPADKNSLAIHLEEVRKSSEKALDNARRALTDAESNHANITAILNRHLIPAEKPSMSQGDREQIARARYNAGEYNGGEMPSFEEAVHGASKPDIDAIASEASLSYRDGE